MVKIPRINRSSEQLTGQSPNRIINRDELTPTGQLISQAGRTLANTGELIERTYSALEREKAQNTYNSKLGEIVSQAELDTDVSPQRRRFYEEEISKAKREAQSLISIPIDRESFGFDADAKGNIAKLKIESSFGNKIIEQRRGEMVIYMENAKNQYILANSAAERQSIILERDAYLNDLVTDWVITSEDAAKTKINHDKVINTAVVKNDIYNDTATQEEDSLILKELKKGKDGSYAFLTPTDRLEMIEDSQRRIQNNNQRYKNDLKETRNQRLEEMWNKAIQGNLTFEDLEDARQIPEELGGIPKSQIENFQTGLERSYKNDLEEVAKTDAKAKKYIDLIDTYIDDKFDRNRAMQKLSEAYADRHINGNEAKFLNQLNNTLTDMAYNKARAKFIYPVRWVKDFFSKEYPEDNKTLALKLKQLLGDISDGKDPQAASKEIIDEMTQKKLSDYNQTAGQRVPVRRISDGAEGTVLESDFDPSVYERLDNAR